ncbi:M23 family metallopeptidase [Streptomyces meridianus]|uniref:LysM peptidoglycan-binding domain-containing M23 family metallopeptidase n=1 Tax=Streptomyces meridianus TaxID=2938945 RepID=A0ABT0X8W9_9ACTN|nr:M23 family metallopeptidase [Streptomyces meridianus]MCM2578979.1 LysM peptidoglycan-binding domain-containing M23 family metallopeptidase [Streptomyces meridianus]
MSDPGRHRRRPPSRLSRASLAVTAGGAGAALPLLAAAGATAADREPWSRPEGCAPPEVRTACPDGAKEVRDAGVETTGERRGAQGGNEEGDRGSATSISRPTSYRVVSGDTLSGIAESEHVAGGWRDLYAGNRRTIGRDPDLILPGQRLVLRDEDRDRRTSGVPAGATPARTRPKPEPDPVQQPDSADKHSAGQEAPDAERKNGEHKKRGGVPRADRAPSADIAAPVPGFAPSTPYRSSGGSWSSGHHTGVDFPVATGTAVKAMARGRVVTAGWGGAYGYQVVIRHPDGKYSQYGHLSALSVRAGQSVNGGQRIGRSGSTGNSTGPHLHFEVRTGPEYGSDIDPLAYLRIHGVDI